MCEHKIGDVVRLNRGWTPMIVLHIGDDGDVWAVYASRNEYYPITRNHYIEWRPAHSYRRHHTGFSKWDGQPINYDWNYIMPRRYRKKSDASEAGVYLNSMRNGDFVLEMDNGSIGTFPQSQLVEDIPETFRVKSMHNNYSCHYELPAGVRIQTKDVLISDTGNVYVVLETGTLNRNPKGVFKGSRLVTAPL